MDLQLVECRALSLDRDGFAKEIGDWAEGVCEKGPWVACTHEHLITALRFLIVQNHFKKLRESTPEVNASAIQAQVNSIRTTLGKIKTIKSRVTSVTDTAGEIAREAEEIRNDIGASLTCNRGDVAYRKKTAQQYSGRRTCEGLAKLAGGSAHGSRVARKQLHVNSLLLA